MSAHKKNVHLGITFPCIECDYVANRKEFLLNHVEGNHKNNQYPCNFCEKVYNQKRSLRMHKKCAHLNTESKTIPSTVNCDICNNGQTFKSKRNLKIHKIYVHSGER